MVAVANLLSHPKWLGMPVPDSAGRYRPYVGWKIGGDFQRRQQRFNFGTVRKEAERRYHLPVMSFGADQAGEAYFTLDTGQIYRFAAQSE